MNRIAKVHCKHRSHRTDPISRVIRADRRQARIRCRRAAWFLRLEGRAP